MRWQLQQEAHLEAGGGGVEGRDDGGRLALGVVEVVPLSSGRADRHTISVNAMVISIWTIIRFAY